MPPKLSSALAPARYRASCPPFLGPSRPTGSGVICLHEASRGSRAGRCMVCASSLRPADLRPWRSFSPLRRFRPLRTGISFSTQRPYFSRILPAPRLHAGQSSRHRPEAAGELDKQVWRTATLSRLIPLPQALCPTLQAGIRLQCSGLDSTLLSGISRRQRR